MFDRETVFGSIGVTWLLVIFIGFIGYLMNFQNLWQYWPADATIGDIVNFPKEWLLSAIGVFAFPLGAITGWIF